MSYLNTIKQGAINAWHTRQILPSIAGAQAILETGSGTSDLARPPHNNHFGIKASADWTGRKVTMSTREYLNGSWVTLYDTFRSYDTITESFEDYGAFFTGTPWRTENYKHVVGETDYKRACWALQNSGYATDPQYATKLITRIENNNLQAWDVEALSSNVTKPPSSNQPILTPAVKTVGSNLTSIAKGTVRELNITVIGDSLGVGTRTHFQTLAPKANYDVVGSRQITHSTASLNATKVLTDMKAAGTLREYVVFIIGTNRGVTQAEVNNVVSIAGVDRKVLFVDTASQVNHAPEVSNQYRQASVRHKNAFYVNWAQHAKPMMAGWYSPDGAGGTYIHMTTEGYRNHAEYIAQAVYQSSVGTFVASGEVAAPAETTQIGIKDIDLAEDGTVKFKGERILEDGTTVVVDETTNIGIEGLYSPLGDENIYYPEANSTWGGTGSVNSSLWIEGRFELSDEGDPIKLIKSAAAELINRGQASVQYNISLMDMPPGISIGDTGTFRDHHYNPPLYIRARVLEITTSETNPSANTVTIGNVVELIPQDNSDILSLQKEIKESADRMKRETIGQQSLAADIVSTNGFILGDAHNETQLVASLKRGVDDVTSSAARVSWERVSNNEEADNTYNQQLESVTAGTLTVLSADIPNGYSKYVARMYNEADQLIQQSGIVLKRVETALWVDTDTPPPDAKDGASWTKPDGTQWVKKDGVWEERVDQALVTAITTELGKAQGKVEEVEELADLLDQKVIEYQQKIGSDGNPEFNKNRADKQQAMSRGEAVPLGHNGYGFVAGKQMTLSFKALCVPITQSDLTLNFTADDLLPLPSPITKSDMTLNLIVPGGTVPTEPIGSNFDNARVVNLSDYGGSSSNTDNFTALKSAINASASEPLVLEVEAGIYNLQGATNDRIQMEPWESAKSKGLRLVGKGDVVFRHKHNRTVNRHEYYFMQLVMSEDSLGFEMENITVDGIRNPQEELFYTQTESNPVPNIPLTRGITTSGAHNVQYKNVIFKNMYGGYAIQMSEYRDVSIQDVVFDKVGGNDIQESFGMAIYLGGHSGNAIVNIDNAQAQGMVTNKELKLSWIGVVLENGSIQSSNPSAWMRDKNTTVNITNSSFMDYQSTFHVESMAGNVYWNVDDLTARGSNYQIVAGVYGEYKESSNNVKMDMTPYGRLWGIVHGLWYTEAQETADNISGHNKMDMYNSVINLKTEAGFGNIPQAVSYGNSVKGYLHNSQLNDVPYKLVQNGSAYLYDSVVNLSQASSETRASLQTGMFGTGAQEVVFDNTLVNTYANRSNVTFGAKPAFVQNTGFVAPFIDLPISPPL